MPALAVWSREDCPLCDELLEELRPWAQARGWPLEVRDVDSDPVAQRRFGLRIPVVTLDGAPICHGRLDLPELERIARGRP